MNLHSCIATLSGDGDLDLPEFATIERVWAFPAQGAVSSANFMIGYGEWLGILAALKIPIIQVTPQTWMKMPWLPRRAVVKRVSGEDPTERRKKKAAAKKEHLAALEATAGRRWPEVEKWTEGTVSAALIAEWGRTNQQGVTP